MTGGLGNAALLALVAIVPLVILTLTSFVKVSVVLSLLRNAIGSPDAPSGLVVTGLSLVLTFFVMAPVAVEMVTAAATPPKGPAPAGVSPQGARLNDARPNDARPNDARPNVVRPTDGQPNGRVVDSLPNTKPSIEQALRTLVPPQYQPELDAAERALGPLRGFLAKHAAEKDRATFVELANKLGHDVRGDEVWVLAPAFITTELREAFMIAILIFIPFLVIDLVVALGLASMGLMTTSPQTISLPLKLLLFVAVDGWRLLLDSLLRGYA
jgi:type III secretion protein R